MKLRLLGTVCSGIFSLVLIATADAAIIVEYTFSDGNTGTATNTGTLGAAMNGSIFGGMIISSPFSPDNQALLLGGNSGNGISMPNGYDFGAAVTVEMLARLDTLQGSDNILFDDFGGPGIYLTVKTSTQRLQMVATTGDNGNITLVSSGTFSLNQWHHIAGVYDGSVLQLYLDGMLVASQSASGLILNHHLVTPNIGIESNEVAFPWLGVIDDFRIHDTALAVSEFNDGNPVPNGDVEPEVTSVTIDVKPGSDPNCFNINGHGVIPVAIHGTQELDVNSIDVTSLLFGGLEVRVRGNKGPLCSVDLVNGDSYLDLVCQFEDDSSNWVAGNSDSATLTGKLLDGTDIEGDDSICIVP